MSGFPPAVIAAGDQFERLTVLGEAGRDKGKRRIYRVRCVCGAERLIRGDRLTDGSSRSCGCLARELTAARNKARGGITHGHHVGGPSRTYRSWQAMKGRCRNPSYAGYENYGGRGIAVCDQWLIFENFLADMGERPADLTLDRIDNNGNYEPGNCRWATATEQSRNRRPPRPIPYDRAAIERAALAIAREAGHVTTASYARRLADAALRAATQVPK